MANSNEVYQLCASKRRLEAAKSAYSANIVSASDDQNVVILIDKDEMNQSVAALKSAFPSHFKHTFAAKANPIIAVLEHFASLSLGIEVASMGELHAALRATGNDYSALVFDSPAKSQAELEFALRHEITLNLDNFQELDRCIDYFNQHPVTTEKHVIGIRINPQVGRGLLKSFSTGGRVSKFGIALEENRQRLIDAFTKYKWLNALHVHVGSQGLSFDMQAKGIRAVVDFALQVNKSLKPLGRKLRVFDIGGGLSVNFCSDQIKPSFKQYADMLAKHVPELFDPSLFERVYTEFGRALIAKHGFAMCHVEYTKQSGGRYFATVQAGADLFVRTVYHPQTWPLRLELITKRDDRLKGYSETTTDDASKIYDIAGPCCFMDIVAFERAFPVDIAPGDFLLFLDVGGYFHSSFSLYNSRQPPSVYFYTKKEKFQFQCISKRKTIQQVLDFYN